MRKKLLAATLGVCMAGSMLYGCGSKEAPAAPDGQAAMSLDSAQEDGDAGKAIRTRQLQGRSGPLFSGMRMQALTGRRIMKN